MINQLTICFIFIPSACNFEYTYIQYVLWKCIFENGWSQSIHRLREMVKLLTIHFKSLPLSSTSSNAFFNMFISQRYFRPIKKEPSMYQRLSAHLNSVELLSELRDSANRISSSSAGSSSTTNDADTSVTIPTKMTRSESITKYQWLSIGKLTFSKLCIPKIIIIKKCDLIIIWR